MNLKNLSSSTLHEKLVSLSLAERNLTLELLHHLREFDCRRLYADRGHSSLFAYVVEELKYSESAAQRRIFAMRALRDLPEMEKKVESGELKVTQLAQIQSFIRLEEKQGNRVSLADKRQLIESTLGKSTRETEKILVEKNPEMAFREKIRVITPAHSQITFTADEELLRDLETVKNRFAHQLPAGASISDLIRFLSRHALKSTPENRPGRELPVQERPFHKQSSQAKLLREPPVDSSLIREQPATSPVEKPLPAPAMKSFSEMTSEKIESRPSAPATLSRYIPAKVRKIVWARDQGQCVFVSNETGKRCGSQHRVQLDHIRPHALRGDNTQENLRLLCATHNALEARKVFGPRAGSSSSRAN